MFPPNTRVLVVDDMATMRKIVSKTCKDVGFSDIQEAADGTKAWEIINSSAVPIQLVISDWNMPNSTGLDLLKRVRSDSRFKQLPFLLVTAESEKQQVIDAMSAGVDGYILKPFNPTQLKDKLEAVHGKYAKK